MKENGKKFEILPMREEHGAALAELERVCFSEPWSLQGLLAELSNDTACFLVAMEENKIAGYLGFHGVCGEGYVANVAVFPQYRRCDVGRALLCRACEEAQKRSLEFLSLEVRCSNLAAIRLYESEGFCFQGIRKGFYHAPQEDAAIYTKRFGGT